MAGTAIEVQIIRPGGKVKSIPLSGKELLVTPEFRE